FVIQEAAERGNHFNAIHLDTSFKIDFWLRKQTDYEEICFSRRVLGTMFERKVWLTSAEDIILSKLLWYKMSPVLDRQLQWDCLVDDGVNTTVVNKPKLLERIG
ncbi:MAG: hypothetical protein KDE58_13685, partial [Caldilineaceae bacterium]|nr:hypothetical protein [Caldilineaceae bacterium]